MHLDYRFYVKFRSKALWRDRMNAIAMETADGEEHTLLEISKVFSSMKEMHRILEPVGRIFDHVTAVEDDAFCFIHDNKKSFDFFSRFTEYLFEEIISVAGDDAVMIADLTDLDADGVGNQIWYYLGGGMEGIGQCLVEEDEGLAQHIAVEISDFAQMLASEQLTQAQKKQLLELTGGEYPTNLMNALNRADATGKMATI